MQLYSLPASRYGMTDSVTRIDSMMAIRAAGTRSMRTCRTRTNKRDFTGANRAVVMATRYQRRDVTSSDFLAWSLSIVCPVYVCVCVCVRVCVVYLYCFIRYLISWFHLVNYGLYVCLFVCSLTAHQHFLGYKCKEKLECN